MYNFNPLKKSVAEIEEWLKKEYAGVRTGRATPALLDNVLIESYGAKQPIGHVASILIEDPKTLRISPWDKSIIKSVEQGLRVSNLGLSISVDDIGIRVGFPELTEETRKTLAKLIGTHLEEAKISLRKEREKIWNDITDKEKEGSISEDDKFRHKDELQKIIDEAGKNLEQIASKKEKEILTI